MVDRGNAGGSRPPIKRVVATAEPGSGRAWATKNFVAVQAMRTAIAGESGLVDVPDSVREAVDTLRVERTQDDI